MYLRFTPPLSVKVAGPGFRQSLSAVLSGMTTVGTLTAVVTNSSNSKDSIIQSLEPIRKALLNDVLLSGINKVGDTLYQWGTAIVAIKDDFKAWLNNYLGPDGLKSGVVVLYEKLYGWIEIVYIWFRDKFIPFLKNIPKIVENWKQIRLSLFKWGTFIGGGGGGALWGMFGSFDNWGKLSELMGNEDFTGAVEKFADLVDKNPEAFGKMGEEEMKEIFQKMMDDPKEANEIAQDLLDEQKQKNEEKKKELEKKGEKDKESQEELDQKQIYESFAQPKGSPKDEGEVFGYLIGDALQTLMKSSSFDSPIALKAKEAMNKYITHIEAESKKGTKAGKAYQTFLKVLDESNKKGDLIDELSKVVAKAFDKSEKIEFEALSRSFETIMKEKYTVPIEGEANGEEVQLDNIVRRTEKRK